MKKRVKDIQELSSIYQSSLRQIPATVTMSSREESGLILESGTSDEGDLEIEAGFEDLEDEEESW